MREYYSDPINKEKSREQKKRYYLNKKKESQINDPGYEN